MDDRVIWGFVRFFQYEQHADDFMRGKIFFNRLLYFRKLESLYDDDGRPDTNEGLMAWLQPHKLEIDFNILRIGRATITERDLAGLVSLSFGDFDHYHVLCLYAVYTTGIIPQRETGKLTDEQINEMRRQIRVDPRCQKFGRFAVCVHPRPFMERMDAELSKLSRKSHRNLVRYYNDATFNGEFSRKDNLFQKQKRFAYQREYRIAVEPGLVLGDDPMTLDIGDLAEFCDKVPSNKVYDTLTGDRAA